MKILIYSDLHISKTSSIMPIQCDDLRFSYRQDKIIKLGRLIAERAKQDNIDLIINCGDTFDSQVNDSSNIECASEFFKAIDETGINHIVLVGNHEMLNDKLNSISFVDNILDSEIIRVNTNKTYFPSSMNQKGTVLAFKPYEDYRNILKLPEGDFLFSHIDIEGSPLNNSITLPGISKEELKKYKLIFNGHIHKDSIIGNVINVGSCTTHGFSDSDDFIPKYYIFDTDTFDLKPYKINLFPLFRKVSVNSIEELNNYIANLDTFYSYILNINCPFDIKDDIKNAIKDNTVIVNYKITTQAITKTAEANKEIEINTNIDICKEFTDFLKTVDLNYPINLYEDIIKGVNKN